MLKFSVQSKRKKVKEKDCSGDDTSENGSIPSSGDHNYNSFYSDPFTSPTSSIQPTSILKTSKAQAESPDKKTIVSILTRRRKEKGNAARRSQSVPRKRSVSFKFPEDEEEDQFAYLPGSGVIALASTKCGSSESLIQFDADVQRSTTDRDQEVPENLVWDVLNANEDNCWRELSVDRPSIEQVPNWDQEYGENVQIPKDLKGEFGQQTGSKDHLDSKKLTSSEYLETDTKRPQSPFLRHGAARRCKRQVPRRHSLQNGAPSSMVHTTQDSTQDDVFLPDDFRNKIDSSGVVTGSENLSYNLKDSNYHVSQNVYGIPQTGFSTFFKPKTGDPGKSSKTSTSESTQSNSNSHTHAHGAVLENPSIDEDDLSSPHVKFEYKSNSQGQNSDKKNNCKNQDTTCMNGVNVCDKKHKNTLDLNSTVDDKRCEHISGNNNSIENGLTLNGVHDTILKSLTNGPQLEVLHKRHKCATLPRMSSLENKPMIITEGCDSESELLRDSTTINQLNSITQFTDKIDFLKRLGGSSHGALFSGNASDADPSSSSDEDDNFDSDSEKLILPSGFLRRYRGSVDSCHSKISSASSGTSDLSSISRGSSQISSASRPGREKKEIRIEDTSYLVDTPSQDSSSGIASDDHNTASANSESSPTYDLIDSKLKSKGHSRYSQRVYSPTEGYESDYVDLAEVARRSGYHGSRCANNKRTQGQGRYSKVTHGSNYGYHETNLDDPSSDCTFVFPEELKGQSRNCDSAPPLYSSRLGYNPNPNMGHNMHHKIHAEIHHSRTRSDNAFITDRHLSPNHLDYSRYTTEYGLKKKQHRVSYFEVVPDDLIIKIFQHLPSDQLCRCARVCRRFYNLAWDPVLWTSIRINDSLVDVDRALKVLTKRLSYETPTVCAIVEKINLSGSERLTDKGLYTVARRCSELRHLDLQGCCNISNIAMFELVSNCVNLEHLNVAGCACITCICLTPEATKQAAHYGKQVYLRYLDMTDCYNLADSGLQIIASYCTQLTYVYLRRCTGITDLGVQYIANYCTNLKEFSINDCRNITDFGLRELSRLETTLRYLSVAKCDKISDAGVRYIAQFCTRLRYLNVRGCDAVSDDSIEMLARCCTRLRSLDLGKCDITDDGLESLAQYAKQLRKLSLKSCESVTDKGLVLLAQHCRGLQQLNIQDCRVTVDAYRTIKRYCKRCIIEHTNPGFY